MDSLILVTTSSIDSVVKLLIIWPKAFFRFLYAAAYFPVVNNILITSLIQKIGPLLAFLKFLTNVFIIFVLNEFLPTIFINE